LAAAAVRFKSVWEEAAAADEDEEGWSKGIDATTALR